jgi:hypothetical protein
MEELMRSQIAALMAGLEAGPDELGRVRLAQSLACQHTAFILPVLQRSVIETDRLLFLNLFLFQPLVAIQSALGLHSAGSEGEELLKGTHFEFCLALGRMMFRAYFEIVERVSAAWASSPTACIQ